MAKLIKNGSTVIFSSDGIVDIQDPPNLFHIRYVNTTNVSIKYGINPLESKYIFDGVYADLLNGDIIPIPYTEQTLKDLIGSFDSGGGGAESGKHGLVDYSDLATQTVPVTLFSGVWTDVPNDGAGANSETGFLPDNVTSLIDVSNGYLDFTELTLGSDLIIRNSFDVNPSTNNALLESRYVLGTGLGEYTLLTSSRRLDDGSGKPYPSERGGFYLYMGNLNTLDNPGKLQVRLSSDGILERSGVAIKIYRR